jgi:D-glycero-alpha-D-manno-heptose-7-phosphate kinase
MQNTMNSVRARAPLRLGLAGGGTDVAPFCDDHGGLVLNATIDRYAYATLKPLEQPLVRFIAADKNRVLELPLDSAYPLDSELDLHKAVYNHMVTQYNSGEPIALELSTFCDAPAGSGLGSSSTLVVAMIKAFAEGLNIPLDDYTLAHLAFKIERVDCGLMGGRQDQYAAAFGGFNFMEFYAEQRAVINQLRIKQSTLCELEASLVLFYTGVSRESAKIIADQSSGVASGSTQALDAMHGLKREALVMKECLLRGDFDGIVESMRQGWESKKRSARSVSTEQMNRIYDAAVQAGALAGKVSGAGGGGFMMFFVEPARRMDVLRTLQEFQGQTSNCHFTKHGSQAWKL